MATRTQRKKSPTATRPHMPGYGIDEEDRAEILPWHWAKDQLSKTQNYFLCTVRSDGRPHIMPIWGIWIDDRFYFSTGKKSVKARNLAGNQNCVLCAGEAAEAVILVGKAAKVRERTVLKRLGAVYSKTYKSRPWCGNGPVFSFPPRVAFGQTDTACVPAETRWRFWARLVGRGKRERSGIAGQE